jgi:hypothetical protein
LRNYSFKASQLDEELISRGRRLSQAITALRLSHSDQEFRIQAPDLGEELVRHSVFCSEMDSRVGDVANGFLSAERMVRPVNEATREGLGAPFGSTLITIPDSHIADLLAERSTPPGESNPPFAWRYEPSPTPGTGSALPEWITDTFSLKSWYDRANALYKDADPITLYKEAQGIYWRTDRLDDWFSWGHSIREDLWAILSGPDDRNLARLKSVLGISGSGRAAAFLAKVGSAAKVGGRFAGPLGFLLNVQTIYDDVRRPQYGDDGVRNSLQNVKNVAWAASSIFPYSPLPVIAIGIEGAQAWDNSQLGAGGRLIWHGFSGNFTGKQGMNELQDIVTQADHQRSGGVLGWGGSQDKARNELQDQLHSWAIRTAVKTGDANGIGLLAETLRAHGYGDDIYNQYHKIAQALYEGKAGTIDSPADADRFIDHYR